MERVTKRYEVVEREPMADNGCPFVVRDNQDSSAVAYTYTRETADLWCRELNETGYVQTPYPNSPSEESQ